VSQKTVEELVEELQVLTGSGCLIHTFNGFADPNLVKYRVHWRLALGSHLGYSEWKSGFVGWNDDHSTGSLTMELRLAIQEATRLKAELLKRLQEPEAT
jgi:hypothetical protein